jgi:hypothetical protein
MRLRTVATSLWLCCCSSEHADVELLTPRRQEFSAVSAVLEPRCGSLDCHGSPARNLRIYGLYGLRRSGLDSTGGADTTAAEIDATYDSLISIDPEVLSRVVSDGGQAPERWIVMSKARGREEHAGGTRLVEGEPADRCVVSWLAGTVDTEACASDSFGPVPREGETW